MTDLESLSKRYLTYMAVRNLAAGTIKQHRFYLRRFFEFLDENGVDDVGAITREVVRGYQTHLYEHINRRGESNCASTQNNGLKVVRAFLRFLVGEGLVGGDPSREVAYARQPKRLPRSVLTQVEMKKILHAPNTKAVLGYRDRAILELLYSTGLRKEEVNNLLLTDVDYLEGYVRVNSGKGDKDRVVPLGKIACRYLENYVKAVRPSLIRDPCEDHLFLSLRGRRLSRNVIWEIVRRCATWSKVMKKVSPHTFRHTCATLMLRNKANIRHIQELLGHASLNTTQVYTSVAITDLKEAHAKCHPRERDDE
jgi:integrase/recombinase XerD